MRKALFTPVKHLSVVYPLLFAMFPVLFLYSFNITQVPTYQVVIALVITLAVVLAMWSIISVIYRNPKKGGLLTFVLLLLFFSYGHVRKALLANNLELGNHQYLLPIWIGLLISGIYFVTRTRSNLRNLTMILNVFAAVLVINLLIQIVPHEIKRWSEKKQVEQAQNAAAINETFEPTSDIQYPDIYYLVFDRYANASVLKESFGYDNSDFINHLTNSGFFVAAESQNNYPNTFLSLNSSLNMQYLDYLEPVRGSNDDTLVYNSLQDYRVQRILKNKGYKIIHFGDWWDPTRVNKFADENVNYPSLGLSGFALILLETTAFNPVIEFFVGDFYNRNRTRTLYKFDKLADMAEVPGPKFVFAHMLIPHDPYVFGPNGEPLTEEERVAQDDVEKYINQLIFTNKKLIHLVDELQAKSATSPIIIIQSDEGPFISPEYLDYAFIKTGDWSQISHEALKTHIKILNAYYLPGFDQSTLSSTITPVNSFRIVFNHYFGADFPLLPDKSYISQGDSRPYNFVDAPDFSSETEPPE